MFFKKVDRMPNDPNQGTAYLITDNWNDWFEFQTLYSLIYINPQGERFDIGGVKVGQFDMKGSRPDIPDVFESLDDRFFSLGQDVSYYETLNKLEEDERSKILFALNDVAYDEELLERSLSQRVMRQSLLRDVQLATVRGQLRRVSHGDAKLTKYKFTYTDQDNGITAPIELSFDVIPESNPPTNIHALIGRNGVGKTRLLTNMIQTLISSDGGYGVFSSRIGKETTQGPFANLVSVTFSAFDNSEPPEEQRDNTDSIRYSYVGLKQYSKPGQPNKPPKSPDLLKREFVESARICRIGAKRQRWIKAIETLETDPMFKEAEISAVAKLEHNFESRANDVFHKLSSGHKIVLLTITRLVETVEEKTLVLIDEPEIYLHPPLLSAFTRTLSDLLVQRNGVAIVATHSPVVLQEVPKSCVWILRRAGRESIVERPVIETFGENIGSLTREVFGLEVTDSGFHKILREAVDELGDFEDIVDHFNDELGMEARSILRALLINSEQGKSSDA